MAVSYEFVKMGSILSPETGKIILDVGNRCEPGIIDHHHIESNTCATKLLLEKPEFARDWLGDAKDAYTLVLHDAPDLDCVSVAYLANRYMREEKFPEGAGMLAEYVCRIDQGMIERPMPQNPRLYEIFEMLRDSIAEEFAPLQNRLRQQLRTAGDGEREILFAQLGDVSRNMNLQIVKRGFELLEHAFAGMRRLGSLEGLFCGEHPFKSEVEQLQKDLELYERDLRDRGRVRILSLPLPTKETGIPQVTDGLYYRDPKARLFKLWARTDREHSPAHEGFIFLMVEWSNSLGAAKDKPKFIISVDHDARVNLVGLGDVLNQAEETAIQKRGLVPAGPPRPGYSLPDPWYDGRGHEYTIVDTPREGTLLEAREVERLVYPFMDLAAFYKLSVHQARCRIVSTFVFDADARPQGGSHLESEGWVLAQGPTVGITPLFRSYLFGRNNLDSKQVLVYEKSLVSQKGECGAGNLGSVSSMQVLLHSQGIGFLVIDLALKPDSAVRLFGWQQRWQQGCRLEDLTREGEGPIAGLGEALSLLPQLGWEPGGIQYTFWSICFEDAHLSRDAGFYQRLLAAFMARKRDPGSLTWSDAREIDDQSKLGQYAYLGLRADGVYLFLNRADQQVSWEERASVTEIFDSAGWFLFLNAALQKGALDQLLEELARISAAGLASRKLNRKLQQLRERAMDILYRSMSHNLTSNSLAGDLWEKATATFRLGELRERVSHSIEELSEYVETRRTALMDKVIAIASLLIAPLTLLTDYMGGILSSRFPTLGNFLTAIMIAYSLTMGAGFLIYLFVRDKKARKKKMAAK